MIGYHLHLDRVAQVRLIGAVPKRGIAIRDLFPVLWRIYFAATTEFFEHASDDRCDGIKDVLLADKRHFQVELIKIGWRTIRAWVFIAKTGCDLEILVEPRHHDQLFELLGCLWKCVEFTRVQAAWHQEIARTFGRRRSDDRGLEFAKLFVPHAFADRCNNIRAQSHVLLHCLAAQVEEAITQACFLGVFLIAKHDQRQFFCSTQHFHVANENFDFTGGQFRVDQALVARFHFAIDTNAPFGSHLFHFGKHRAIGVAQHLRHAVVIAQIDKQNATVIPDAVHPARKTNSLSNVLRGQCGAGMGAECMHVAGPQRANFGPIHPFGLGKSSHGPVDAKK